MIMSKWKCGICNKEFDNFQAQGFDGTIYCPLCYYKELYRRTELERERLNNIINELEEFILNHYIVGHTVQNASLDAILLKLKELKEENK